MDPLKLGNLYVPVPIIQGGMGIGISLSGLASAVANMGGIGVISTVGIGLTESGANLRNYKTRNIDFLRDEIRKARALTNGVLGVNIMSVLTNFSDMVRTSIEEGIDIIFSGAGLPLDLPAYLKNGAVTKLVPIVSSKRAAAIICNKWKKNYDYLPDAIVVEGPKAGGHLGYKAEKLKDKSNELPNIIADVVELTSEMKEKHNKIIPIIAAGGIFNGKDIYHIMAKGADAVQLGTRFVATKECDASEAFKNAYLKAKKEDIQIIKSPVGMPGRSIQNEFLLEAENGERKPTNCAYHCIKSCNHQSTSFCISKALTAAFKGNLNDGFVFAGANAWRIKKISSVKEVFMELISDYNKSLRKFEKILTFSI